MSEDTDKSQEATPYKLREAQKKGQVAKSNEANFAAILAALVAIVFAVGPGMARQELGIAQHVLRDAGRTDWSSNGTLEWLLQATFDSMAVIAPLLIAICVVAVLVNVSQVGGIFSFDPITPDFTKLNPATGMQRLFSKRVIYDALRSLAKLAILGCVTWGALRHLMPDMLKLNYINARSHASVVLGTVGPLLFKLFLAILIIALIDLLYTRWEYAKKMRMSHKDITDEHKQKEGDPRIRQRIRQLRAELLKQSQAVGKLPEADVLITNPTHIAVAISYRHGEMSAPKLLAKGKGELAAKMRAVARQHNIPVVENPPLARELYKRLNSDQFVPEDMYPKVAKILIWVYAMRKNRQQNKRSGLRGAFA
ncbi:EscU/YscU/HrcU family type III secretion system export apparatus switch protein [Undibacterium sp. TJN19]|uniref:EscU/YscU/HrcU family type III secretion system export apparatus switch protein n=1 Tax=Undibacterium sp. TJN19 TaxID=3413055 RepID=UPI003BF0CF05